MNFILNFLSVISTLYLALFLIYQFINLLFGRNSFLNKCVAVRINLKVKHILFPIIGLILMLRFSTFYLPYN